MNSKCIFIANSGYLLVIQFNYLTIKSYMPTVSFLCLLCLHMTIAHRMITDLATYVLILMYKFSQTAKLQHNLCVRV